MIKSKSKRVKVGYVHTEHDGKQRIQELRFDRPTCYEGELLGFGVQGEDSEMFCFALVRKDDGTYDTPSVCCVEDLSLTCQEQLGALKTLYGIVLNPPYA
jgi:hypothetical protein